MTLVHTEYGPGTIVASETVRGRVQYKVAGQDFQVWLDETRIRTADVQSSGGPDGGAASTSTGGASAGQAVAPTPPPTDFGATPESFNAAPAGGGGMPDTSGMAADMNVMASRYAWAPVDHDNSTTLPYDPTPQNPAYPANDESTIQPIHQVDADDRLDSSDSITFEDRGDGDADQDHLFAKRAGLYEDGNPDDPNSPYYLAPEDRPGSLEELLSSPRNEDVILPWTNEDWEQAENHDPTDRYRNHPDSWSHQPTEQDYAEWERRHGSVHEAILPALVAPLVAGGGAAAGAGGLGAAAGGLARALGPAVARGGISHALSGGGGEEGGGQEGGEEGMDWEGGWGEDLHGGWKHSSRPAGLSDRYIDITAGADYHNDPVAQFRHDPDAYINRIGHIMSAEVDPQMEAYGQLVEADRSIREAAWTDVRQKAMRLRREGKVHVFSADSNAIYANVEGDNGQYEVMILTGNVYPNGGFNGGKKAIANWKCGCKWGDWAFKRQRTFVGRLCSHGYATYLEMQAQHLNRKPKTAPKRRKKADALQGEPQRLVPDFAVNDTDDSQIFERLDVTDDDRTELEPEQILHFSNRRRADVSGENDQTPDDWQIDDAAEGLSALEDLRDWADGNQEDDLGSMADRNDEVRDDVQQARDSGMDADQFVAMKLGWIKRAAPNPDDYLPYSPGRPPSSTPTGPVADLITRGNPGPSENPPAPKGPSSPVSGPVLPYTPETGGSRGVQMPDSNIMNPGGVYTNSGSSQPSPSTKGGDSWLKQQYPGSGSGDTGGGDTNPTGNDQGIQGPGIAGNPGGPPEGGKIEQGEYTIQSGDTLSDIAQRSGYGDDYASLGSANSISNYDQINAGDKINIGTPGNSEGIQGPGIEGNPGGAIDTPAAPDVPGPEAITPAANDAAGAAGNAGSTPDQTVAMRLGWIHQAGVEEEGTPQVDPASVTDAGAQQTGTNPAPSGVNPGPSPVDLPGIAPESDPDAAARAAAGSAGADLEDPSQEGPSSEAGKAAVGLIDPEEASDGHDHSGHDHGDTVGGGAAGGLVGTGLGGFDMDGLSGVMDTVNSVGGMIGDGIGMASDIAGSIGSALGGILGSRDPGFAEAGGFLPHKPFAGSGAYEDSLEFGTSEDYIDDNERDDFEDVTDLPNRDYHGGLDEYREASRYFFAEGEEAVAVDPAPGVQFGSDSGGGDLPGPESFAANTDNGYTALPESEYDTDAVGTTNHDNDSNSATSTKLRNKELIQRGASRDPLERISAADYEDPGMTDVVAAFQRSAGAQAVMGNGSSGPGDADIANAAAGFLRTAGRTYSMAEQMELVAERHPQGARNLNDLELSGTHYEAGW